MTSIVKTMSVAVLGLTAAAAPAMAGSNWMRDYVHLRTAAMNARASGDAVVAGTASGRIVGGTVAPNKIHKFQVALLQKAQPDNFQAQYCGGTLVKQNYVVTAAHCSDFVIADQVQVLTGTQDLDGTGVRRNVTQIDIHPKWDDVTFDYDVAVWRLETNAANIPLATLTAGDAAVGTTLKTTGWGALSEGGSFPINLRMVDVPVVSTANCNDRNSYRGQITSRMFCAGFDQGGKDSCQGDSGGPITRNAGSGFRVLTGIVSWGDGCARANKFGIYTRIANPEVKNFIASKIGN